MAKQQKFNFNAPGKTIDPIMVTSEKSEVLKSIDKQLDEKSLTSSKNVFQNELNNVSEGDDLKTILELANEIGVTKQQIYRHIKYHTIDVIHINGVMYLSDAVQCNIKSAFFKNDTTSKMHHEAPREVLHDAHDEVSNDIIIYLQRELEKKDQIIGFLQNTIIQYQESLSKEQESLQNSQKLHLLSRTVNTKVLEEKTGIWGKFKAKKGNERA